MDVNKALRELYDEKKRLDRAIARIEARLATVSEAPKRSTRGRKSMSPEERLRVSARMTAYWAARRAQGGTPEPDGADVEKEEFAPSDDSEPETGVSGVSA
jgi:hypothetical protein